MLTEAICELCAQGACSITVVPIFISALGHVLKDVPVEVEAARTRCPDINIEVSQAIGEMPEVQDAFRKALVSLMLKD